MRSFLLVALLLGLSCAISAMDPRLCFPSDPYKFGVKNGRLMDLRARKLNQKAVTAVNLDLRKLKMLSPGCLKDFSWEAVEGCFDPAKEGGKKSNPKGEFKFRWIPHLNKACKKDSKNIPQLAAWVDTDRYGKIKKIEWSIDAVGHDKIHTIKLRSKPPVTDEGSRHATAGCPILGAACCA